MIEYWTYFILGTLAVWRVTRLLVYEDGPFFIFRRFRMLLGVQYIENSPDDEEIRATNPIALMILCPLCTSMWLAIPMVFYFKWGWLEWLAISGAVSMLFRFTDKD